MTFAELVTIARFFRFLLKLQFVKAKRMNRKPRLEEITRDEVRLWRESNEGLTLPEMIASRNLGRPAHPDFIAKLRLDQEEDRDFVDDVMAAEEVLCTICQSLLEEGETYTVAPCEGGHQFHEDCLIQQLRTKNICPNCRFEFPEADPHPWENTTFIFLNNTMQFFRQIV